MNAENQSEVARLLSQISAEYEAAKRGLMGLSSGSARHDFITARTENISNCYLQLRSLVGDDATAELAHQVDLQLEKSR
ncbi:MAG: hypothetical protein JOZ18_01690 [Chloroflexi bacterium]|nr:hypothetical protein [Chloroflexota bacterium]